MDRDAAVPGEYLFFKAYTVTGPKRYRVSPSGVLKVDLIDPTGMLTSTQYYPLRDGMAQGAVGIPKDLEPNTYTLRAYTRWMQNYGRRQFFTKPIRITAEDDAMPEAASVPQVVEVQIFPEGGHLLHGLNNKLIIRAQDPEGNPVVLKGDIRDQSGRRIVDVKQYDTGIGMSILSPESGAAYSLHLENGQQFPLPEVSDTGYSLQVNPLHPDHIKVSVSAVGLKKAPLQLKGKVGSQVILAEDLELDATGSIQLEIPKSQLPAGILHFELLGTGNEVLAQRPVRIGGAETLNVELFQMGQDLSEGGMNTYRLKVTDRAGNPVKTTVSVSVVEETALQTPGLMDIEHPNPGATQIAVFRKTLFLDDLHALATGASTGEKLLPNEIKYPIQRTLELIGYAYDLNNELLRNTDIQVMSSTDENLFISEVRTDASGILKVTGMDFSGEIPLIFRTKGEDTRESLVRFEPLHDEIFKKNEPFVVQRPESENKRKGQEVVETTPWAVIDTTGLIRLAEATITAKKQEVQESPSNYGIEPMKVIRQDPKKPAVSIGALLQQIPGVFVSGDIFNAPNIRIPRTPPGPVRWVVDGLLLVANEHPFDLVPVIDVERIEILSASDASIYGSRGTGAIIAIYTRNGSGADYVRRKDAMVTFKGFEAPLDFEQYLALREDNRKLRKQRLTTLYWNPEIVTDEKGEALVRFTSPADYTGVRIQVEALTPQGNRGSLQEVVHRVDSQ